MELDNSPHWQRSVAVGMIDLPLGFTPERCRSQSYRLLLLLVLTVHVSSAAYINVYMEYISDDVYDKRTVDIFGMLQSFGGVVNTVASIAWLVYNRNRLQAVLYNLEEIKSHLHSDRTLIKYCKEVSIFFFVFVVPTLLIGAYFDEKSLRFQVAGLSTFSISFFFSFCFSGQVSCLFRFLGSFYDDFLRSKKYEESVIWYQLMSNVFDDICQLYKLPIFLMVGWSFILSVVHLYILFYPMFPNQIWYNMSCSVWIFYFLYPVVLVIRSSNEIRKKVHKFNEHLYWKMVDDKSCQLLNNEKLEFHFIVWEEMQFTACGFFTIDNSLICSMISTATTYLVIVLQYGKDRPTATLASISTTLSIHEF